jgi:hypothetical protein
MPSRHAERAPIEHRVARWYHFNPKISIWVNFVVHWNGKGWYILWLLGIYILRSFVHLWTFGNLVVIWYTFSHFWYIVWIKIWQPWLNRLRLIRVLKMGTNFCNGWNGSRSSWRSSAVTSCSSSTSAAAASSSAASGTSRTGFRERSRLRAASGRSARSTARPSNSGD